MSIHNEMSDLEVLRTAAESLSGIPVAHPPDLEPIIVRGRAHRARRTRRLAGTATLSVATAAGTALALGLTGALSPAPTPATGTIRTAAFTLASNPDGTATLTIKDDELLDTAALQRDLTQFGIPSKVTSGSFCSSDPAPGDFSQVVRFPSSPDQPIDTVTIDPAAIPAGAALSVGVFPLSSGDQGELALIDTSSYTCSSTPDGRGAAMGLVPAEPSS